MDDAVPPSADGPVWRFDGLTLDTAKAELRRDGVLVAAEPQSLAILAYLIARRDRVVPREELVAAVWKRAAVSDWAVAAAIRAVRRALDDTGRKKRLLRAVHGTGCPCVGRIEGAAEGPLLVVLPFDDPAGGHTPFPGVGIAGDLATEPGTIAGLRVRVLWEAGDSVAATAAPARLAEIAPRYDLAAAARMFPYPPEPERSRLRDALAGAGFR
jgi:DNA-binding winged helix-turn-helix (wHTH) protein